MLVILKLWNLISNAPAPKTQQEWLPRGVQARGDLNIANRFL